MKPGKARHLRIRPPVTAYLATLLTCTALSLPSLAQDTKGNECAANEKNTGGDCSAPIIATADEHPLDWAPLYAVPPELRDAQCQRCEGSYLDPLADEDRNVRLEEIPIEATANSSEVRGDTIMLEGGIEVIQGYRRLRSDRASIDQLKQSGEMTGNVSLREPGILLLGERAEIYARTGEATIENSQFVLHEQHMRGSAENLLRDSEGKIYINDGSFSFCAPGENDWAIGANQMELDLDEGLGTLRGAKIRLGGVPVFYTPWMQIPLDDRRRTGFLWPDIGSDSQGGVDIAVPVYLNIAPNWDAIYAPRFIQDRGTNHEVRLRHLNRWLGAWEVGGAYLNDDDQYEQDFPDERNHDRWLAVVKHNGLFSQRWRSRVDYSKASDVQYMKDLDTTSLESKRRTSLLQQANLDYLGDRWLLEMDLQQFQTLADDIRDDYKKLPQITAQYRPEGTPFTIDPIFLAQYSHFDTDSERVTGERLYGEAGLAYPMRWSYGFLEPTAKIRHVSYELDDSLIFTDDSPSTSTGLFSLDGGLYFDRSTQMAGKNLLQTLEPRLFYLYSDYEDQSDQPDFDSAELTFSYNQLFRETRFSGHDRLDDANQLSVGLTTRLIDDSDGREKLNATIGQIFYFEDNRVRLNPLDEPLDKSRSEIAAEFNFYPNERFEFRSNMIWDPDTDKVNSGYFQSTYRWHENKIVNLGYSFRRPLTTVIDKPVVEQVNISTYFPINRDWSFFAAFNYSLEADTAVEDMFGLEYDSCCWKVRLLHLRYYDNESGQNPDFNDPNLQREHSIQVQFVLKGLGGFGNRITSIMEDMIRGFKDVEY
jgi:LPS-assembly protein